LAGVSGGAGGQAREAGVAALPRHLVLREEERR
jgi:hypothetical protein